MLKLNSLLKAKYLLNVSQSSDIGSFLYLPKTTIVSFPPVPKSFFSIRKNNFDHSLICGRSMVEMLGVLAIIGVLSVGAITGYQKAMLKHKLNKFSTQFSEIINNSITTSSQFDPPAPSPGTSSAYNLMPYYTKMGFIPAEMIRKNVPLTLYTVFNTSINILYINGDPILLLI